MPIPSDIDDLSPVPGDNSPAGSESPTEGDNYIRALSAIIRQNYDAYADTADALNGAGLVGYNPALAYASGLGQFLNYLHARTAGEIAAGVTPTNYAYSPGDVRRYGAVGDGATDDTTALQNALASAAEYSHIEFERGGVYLTSAQLTVSVNNITLRGRATIKAKAGTVFEYVLYGTGRTGVRVEGLTFDANRSNRTSGQNVRYMCAAFLASTDCAFIDCTAMNAVGYSNIPGVGLTIAGNSTRGLLYGCKLLDCGGSAGTDAADGIFTSGEQNLIAFCQAKNCTDTAFVVESSNHSGIIGCTAYDCAASGAITNASSDDKRGSYINGLTGRNWNAANTGGVQIGVPTNTAGNLYDTRLDGVVMYADTATYGNGPAISVRKDVGGKAIGVSINAPRINGSKNQGILVSGDDVTINDPRISGSTDAAVQFQTGTTEGMVIGGYINGGSYSVITSGTASAIAKGVTTTGQTNQAYYAFSTSTLRVVEPTVLTGTAYGSDSGASIKAATTGREFAITYSASMTIDASLGDTAVITATNNTAFTINAPTNPVVDRTLTVRVRNGAGSALGAVTWDAAFKLATWTSPASGFSRSITFKYNGSNWIETSRVSTDVPN